MKHMMHERHTLLYAKRNSEINKTKPGSLRNADAYKPKTLQTLQEPHMSSLSIINYQLSIITINYSVINYSLIYT